MKFPSHDPRTGRYGGPCWLCRRMDGGFGFMEGSAFKPRVVWACARHMNKRLYEMAKKLSPVEFQRIEKEAMLEAGEKAGAYLDSIDKTDLAQLDEVQWVTFLKTVVTAFGDHIEKHLEEVPF